MTSQVLGLGLVGHGLGLGLAGHGLGLGLVGHGLDSITVLWQLRSRPSHAVVNAKWKRFRVRCV